MKAPVFGSSIAGRVYGGCVMPLDWSNPTISGSSIQTVVDGNRLYPRQYLTKAIHGETVATTGKSLSAYFVFIVFGDQGRPGVMHGIS